MEKRNPLNKLRSMPFSLSPKGDRQPPTPQNAATFLNIFSIKDQSRSCKKNLDTLKFAEPSLQKFPEVATTPNIEKKIEISKRMFLKQSSIPVKKEEKALVKRPENPKVTNIRSEKALEFREVEGLEKGGDKVKTIKNEKEEKKEKYMNTPENKLKLFFYFRFHLHSLLVNIGKRETIEDLSNSLPLQVALPNIKKSHSITVDSKEQASICHRLLKIISTKSKYKSRYKLVFSKSIGLKSINYEPKKRATLIPKPKKSPLQDQKKEVVSTQNIPSFVMNDFDYWRKKNINNSIAKYSENFEKSEIEGNMWTMQEFINYLIKETGEDIFTTKIQPKFKQYVIDTLKSCVEMVSKRKNTFEIFGFDFMIDDKYHPWIIEINQSPAMDYSTPVTEKLVPLFLEDVLKVVLDHGMAKKGQRKKVDTGLFACICKGNRIKI